MKTGLGEAINGLEGELDDIKEYKPQEDEAAVAADAAGDLQEDE